MKIKCVDVHHPATSGFFGMGAKPKTRIDGLTLGKEYEAQAVPMVGGSGNIGAGHIETTVYFMIFNDNNEWGYYQPKNFTPA